MRDPSSTAPISVSVLLKLDDICMHFEDQWRAGQRPDLASALAAVSELEDGQLLEELLPLEWHYRFH
jgi:hypothetical protein